MARNQALSFSAITMEGAIIAPAMLQRIAGREADGQSDSDYGLPKGLTLRDELARYFRIGQAHWREFAAIDEPTLGQTAAFTQALLKDVFGFDDIVRAPIREVHGRRFPIALEAQDGNMPVAVAPRRAGLDSGLPELGHHTRRSASLLTQEWLNAKPEFYWGLASSGDRLRLLRDNASFTRPAYIEADLKLIFDDEAFADFSALWLLIHSTRFRISDGPSDCWLEKWREAGLREGVAARDRLRGGFEAALLSLGNGFLSHPANAALSERLRNGELSLPTYFSQLLRLVYRLIFLLAAEDRGLLHLPTTKADARRLYADGYSVGRLRDRSVRRAAWDRHYDAWEGLLVTFQALSRGEPGLGLPALGGLFEVGVLADLEPARLSNAALLEAIYRLAWLRDAGGPVPVNWRDMETEELGSVYESLLELTPRLTESGHGFSFAEGAEAKGNARKTSGSYYTPDSLVQSLLDSALNPVLERAERDEDPAKALLSLSIIDPACGSGHFLLAAARRIASRLARAQAGGVASAADYRHALRDVVRSCIYGVDKNPMAVELAKVALWIETVDPGKPLGFLDANIRCGDALLGVFSLDEVKQGIPDAAYKPLTGDDKDTSRYYARRNRAEREGQGILDFGHGGGRLPAAQPLASGAAAFHAMPEDTTEQIREKRRAFERVKNGDWKLRQAADLFVSSFLMPKNGGEPVNRNRPAVPTTAHVWATLVGQQIHGELIAKAHDLAGRARTLHWPLAFPEIILGNGGFDVVLGNPPWERIKLQEQEFFAARHPEIAGARNAAARTKLIKKLADSEPGSLGRSLYEEFEGAKREAEAASVFAREEGRFPLTGRGDVNTYALFAELFSRLVRPSGRAGMIVPTGVATDATTAGFFEHLISTGLLASLFSAYEVRQWFKGTDDRKSFCLLTLGRSDRPSFVFAFKQLQEISDPRRQFTLSPAEIARINPNTKTAPIFRARADAELTAKIYARVPVLVDEGKGASGNLWGISFMRMFDMANDSHLFLTAAQLIDKAYVREGSEWGRSGEPRYVPLYEAKMIHHFDHRWSTYEAEDGRDLMLQEKQDPDFEPSPRYWVPQCEVANRLEAKGYKRGWLMGWRDISLASVERTVVGSVIPLAGVGHPFPLYFLDADPRKAACFMANLASLTLDFVARQKIGGTHLTYSYLNQFPVLPPSTYGRADLDHIIPRVLELSYTSHSVASFARDLGYYGPPFAWDEDRRARLRAELDAWYARAYGLTRDELRYILDPTDVMGVDYPSETFRVLKANEIRRFGEYRTGRFVLEAWDRLERGQGDQAPAPTASLRVEPLDISKLADAAWATPTGGNPKDKTLVLLAALLKALPGPTAISLARQAAVYTLEPRLLTRHLDPGRRSEWRRLVGSEAEPRDGVATLGLGGAVGWGEAVRQLIADGALIEDSTSQSWSPGTGLDAYFTDSWPQRASFALDATCAIAARKMVQTLSAEEEEGLAALAA
jgi:hypothetical protein